MSRNASKKPVGFATHITAGGMAGACEALACQPLDTIKVRMQLSRSGRTPGTKARGFFQTGMQIVKRETPLALYKGLGAVLSGIVPKMAIRFASFERYKSWLADKQTGKTSVGGIFVAGLGAGVTEAVAVVTPMEVVKIRLQAQSHSLADPFEIPRYRNAAHAVYTIVREEGFATLYRGVSLTALRQATNQGANFTAYQEIKKFAHKMQPDLVELPSYQHMMIGLISGAMGPFSNAPIDTIKTRLQKQVAAPGQSAFQRILAIAADMWKHEGVHSFYKGITPRVLRVAPGQAVVFAVYERNLYRLHQHHPLHSPAHAMSGTFTVSSTGATTFTQGSIMLTPTKRMRNGLPKASETKQKTPTHQEIFAWTLTNEATAQCRIGDVHQLKESEKGADFFWLGRVPCRNVKITGMVVGVSVYESRIIYTLDDGTGLIDCNRKEEAHKSKKLKLDEKTVTVPEDLIPIATVGDFARVKGRVIPKYGSRQIVVSEIVRCRSGNEELVHHQRVEELHRDHYSSTVPFIIPEPKPEPKPVTPRRVVPPTPVAVIESSPAPIPSPVKSEAAPTSPHRLRHPSRLRSADLTANTFRIYLKHFMDHDAPPTASAIQGGEDPFTSSTPRRPDDQQTPRASSSRSRIQRPSIEPISFPGLPPKRVISCEEELSPLLGYTISYLRRVPELAFLAKRVLRHEIRANVRKAREAKAKSSRSSGSQLKPEQLKPSPREVKRLFTHAIMQLYREGSIVMWAGPKRSLRDIKDGETSRLWKANTSSTSMDAAGGNSTTLYGNSKSAITLDLDDEPFSDPQPNEESYIPLKIPYLADRIVEILPRVKASVQTKSKVETYFGATPAQLAKFLQSDDQWRFVRQDSVDEALEYLEQESRVWCPVKGQWDLTLL
ncbi:succinate:fumarate antiporter [Coprinopsis sp. MPI-PUGE-AT-0042]|nr:succinate:fumarate antiporter [Coprinopsis sp. MPI-PUGE-AT-0042]